MTTRHNTTTPALFGAGVWACVGLGGRRLVYQHEQIADVAAEVGADTGCVTKLDALNGVVGKPENGTHRHSCIALHFTQADRPAGGLSFLSKQYSELALHFHTSRVYVMSRIRQV